MTDSDNYDMEVKINKSDIESNISVNIDLEGTSKICPDCGVIIEIIDGVAYKLDVTYKLDED